MEPRKFHYIYIFSDNSRCSEVGKKFPIGKRITLQGQFVLVGFYGTSKDKTFFVITFILDQLQELLKHSFSFIYWVSCAITLSSHLR